MEFYGLFGNPLGHSKSPEIHRIIYDQAGIDAAYKLMELEADDLEKGIEAVKILAVGGVNVTVPYKKQVIPYLDDISAKAKKLNAVNTIDNVKGRLIGHNTDYDGVLRTFQRHGWVLQDKKVFVLGSGGSSQAVCHCLQDQGALVTMVSRHPEQDGDFAMIDYDQLAQEGGDILVNATPVGMPPNIELSPVNEAVINRFDIIFDVIYGAEPNAFLKMADRLGKDYADGLEMLICQAVKAVEIWQGTHIDEGIVDDILGYFEKEWRVNG